MKELIKHILTEETNLKTRIHNIIKNLGIRRTMKIFGGNDRFMKKMDINTPMDYLHLFDDLDVAQSEENPDWSLFRYKPKNNLMVYDRNKDKVYINYDEIWSVLYKSFGLSYSEIEELTERWLSEVYNLSGVTIAWNNLNVQFMLSESHNLKRILREESKIPLYIRRRFDCMDRYINRLEQEPGIIPIGRELLSWEHYQIIVTAYIRDNCGDDGYYNENLHNLIMDVFGERLYEWFKKNG